MALLRGRLLFICTAIYLLAVPAVAKRIPPKPVSPVIAGGIKYEASGDGQDQYVIASDAANGKELWKVKVFRSHIKFWEEPDVQLVFITDLKLAGSSLLVKDERSRCYSLDLNTKSVRKTHCEVLNQK